MPSDNQHEVRAAWIQALRLRTLPLTAAGTLIAASIAAVNKCFDAGVFIAMLFTSVLLQIVSNFADDYGDLSHGLDDESRVGPKRGLQRGVITVPQMRRALIGVCALTFVVGVILIVRAFVRGPELGQGTIIAAVVFLVIGIAAIAAALLYTMGKHPYGYIGLGDFMSFLFFGIVSVVGGSFLYMHEFTWVSLMAGIAMGLPVMAVMNINDMRDNTRDAAKGKRTVANMLGDPAMRVYETVMLAASAVLFIVAAAMCGAGNPLAYVLLVASFIPWALTVRRLWSIPDPEHFDRLMAPTSFGSVLVAIIWLIAVLIG